MLGCGNREREVEEHAWWGVTPPQITETHGFRANQEIRRKLPAGLQLRWEAKAAAERSGPRISGEAGSRRCARGGSRARQLCGAGAGPRSPGRPTAAKPSAHTFTCEGGWFLGP